MLSPTPSSLALVVVVATATAVTAAVSLTDKLAVESSSDPLHTQGGRRRLAAGDNFPPARDAATALGLPSVWSVPQFVLLAFNGAITPQAYDLYRPLSTLRSPVDGCPIKATWFANVAQSADAAPMTKCDIVAGLRKSGHEIATHTYGLTINPTADEIEGAVDWLNETCGVPREELRGFRTPGLGFTQDTFENLAELGMLYDSSIADHQLGSDSGRQHWWPYTMDGGIPQACVASAGSCDPSKSNPGLWEVPLWRLYGEDDIPKIPIDWFDDDVIGTLERNFDRRYNAGGNRAPLAINVKISWLATNLDNFTSWINDTLSSHDDVYFVTNYELIQWMRDPVPSWEYKALAENSCANLVTDCFIPSSLDGGCGHGSFDTEACKCDCPHPWGEDHCLTKISDFWTPPPTPVPTVNPTTTEPTARPSTALPTISFVPTSSTDSPTSLPTLMPATTAPASPDAGTRSAGVAYCVGAYSAASFVGYSALAALLASAL